MPLLSRVMTSTSTRSVPARKTGGCGAGCGGACASSGAHWRRARGSGAGRSWRYFAAMPAIIRSYFRRSFFSSHAIRAPSSDQAGNEAFFAPVSVCLAALVVEQRQRTALALRVDEQVRRGRCPAEVAAGRDRFVHPFADRLAVDLQRPDVKLLRGRLRPPSPRRRTCPCCARRRPRRLSRGPRLARPRASPPRARSERS